jgi:hypothetical protein
MPPGCDAHGTHVSSRDAAQIYFHLQSVKGGAVLETAERISEDGVGGSHEKEAPFPAERTAGFLSITN